jgi:hypothetical protein
VVWEDPVMAKQAMPEMRPMNGAANPWAQKLSAGRPSARSQPRVSDDLEHGSPLAGEGSPLDDLSHLL